MLAPNAFVCNRYLIVRQVGAGSAGAVYEALDMQNRMHVALKQLIGRAPESARYAALFDSLGHPAMPPLLDAFAEGGDAFLAMEYVHGDDLGTQAERNGRTFGVSQVLGWADQLLDVLSYLHARQPPLIHRDIKPQNLKLTPHGQVMLLDIGLEPAGPTQGKLLGGKAVSSFQFTAPEQVQAAAGDERSDLYGLAATMYYLLAGTLPLLAGRRINAAARGQDDPLPPPHELNPQVPGVISTVLMRALSLDPDWRYESAQAMRMALDRARASAGIPVATPIVPPPAVAERAPVAGPILATSPSQRPPAPIPPTLPAMSAGAANAPAAMPQQPPWRWIALATMGVAALLIVVLLAFLLLRQDDPDAPFDPARPTALAASPTEATSTDMAPTQQLGVAARPASTRLPGPDLLAATPSAAPAPTDVPVARVASVEPLSAYVGAGQLVLTVRGAHLDQVRAVRLIAPGHGSLDTAVRHNGADQLLLDVPPPREPLNGEASFQLELNGTLLEAPAITLRDFLDRRTLQGVLPEYGYSGRVATDAAGAYTTLHAEASAASQPVARLHNGDTVDLLRDGVPEWYFVRVSVAADAAQNGASGWIERWLVDNQGVPAAPAATPTPAALVFAGRIYGTPTDAAAQCGKSFESSIYGSVENNSGRGIAGARLRITSADGRNVYTVTTRRGGIYSVPGLGCTAWTVRLLSVPNAPNGIRAGAVTVRNLNGGRYTSAEVRFRQR